MLNKFKSFLKIILIIIAFPFYFILAIIFLIIMISYTRSRAENEGVDMKGVGFMERAERLIYLMFIL